MKLHRIYAIILRYIYLFKHSFDRLADTFYWPIIDLAIWGLTSAYFIRLSPASSNIIQIVLTGILLWIIVWRGQYEITVNLLEDLWNKNLINIFSAPLKFNEWIIAFIIIGIIKAVISFLFAAAVAFIFYQFKIFIYGFYLVPFFILLIMTGWWVGLIVAAIILRFGTRVQTLAWAVIGLIFPFSAIFYPMTILPPWAQRISALLPTTYIFEGVREIINKGSIDIRKIITALILNLVYLSLSYIVLRRSFDKVLEKGLVKLF